MTNSTLYLNPPFAITRTSHVSLSVRNLDEAVNFYTQVAGMVVSLIDKGTAYLRGIEEIAHHSLILRQSSESPTCDYIGFRVAQDKDIDLAEAYFAKLGVTTKRVQRPHQGPSLLVHHSSGIPFELTSSMSKQKRVLTDYANHKGARALRIDHYQVIVPEVGTIGKSFMDFGFRASEMIVQSETDKHLGIFLHRKNNPHDLVLAMGAGPRLHHFAFVTSDLQNMIRACDIAGNLGHGKDVERGPGRHGPGNGMFVYFRDPDGHRLEIILPPMQYMDQDEETRVWNSADKHMIVPWGQPASKSWLEEASLFTNVEINDKDNLARWVSR